MRENDVPSQDSQQVQIVPQLGMSLHESLSDHLILVGLLFCMFFKCSQSKDHVLAYMNIDSFHLSALFFYNESCTLVRSVIYVPFRTGHFTFSYSLHFDHIWLSVLISIYEDNILLIKGKRYIYEYKNKSLVDSFILSSFSRVVVSGSPLGLMM